MIDFSAEEQMLMMLYSPGTRQGLITELEAMKQQLTVKERKLGRLVDSVLDKSRQISDREFESLDFYPNDSE